MVEHRLTTATSLYANFPATRSRQGAAKLRLLLPLITVLILAAACTAQGDDLLETPCADCESDPGIEAISEAEWTAASVLAEIGRQVAERRSVSVHRFGLNVEEGEEFIHSGRDPLPAPPDTSRWTAEIDGEGVWIIDTGELLYRFREDDSSFDVLWDYSTRG